MRTANKKILLLLLMTVIVLAIAPMFSIPAAAADTPVDITGMDVVDIQTAIQGAIAGSGAGDTVTVTGSKTDVYGETLTLNIPADITVIWKAEYAGEMAGWTWENILIYVSGGGAFEIDAGGDIRLDITNFEMGSIFNFDQIEVTIIGGMVTATSTAVCSAITLVDSNVSVSDGTISSHGNAIEIHHGNGLVSGGTILSSGEYGRAIYVADSDLLVSGGDIKRNGEYGSAIYILDSNSRVTITDGTITAEGGSNDAISLLYGDVLVSGGTISAVGNWSYAVNAYEGNLTVTGGSIYADIDDGDDSCYAIYAYKDCIIKITDGTVEATSTGGGTGDCYAIYVDDDVAVAYLSSTIIGGDVCIASTSRDNLIVEVATTVVNSTWHGSDYNINIIDGGGSVSWDTSGPTPLIEFYNDSSVLFATIEWGLSNIITLDSTMDVPDIEALIYEVIDGSGAGDTVTVTGSKTGVVDDMLTLYIPPGVTVVWEAEYIGSMDRGFFDDNILIYVYGGGAFEIADGSDIQGDFPNDGGRTFYLWEIEATVSGGDVSANGMSAVAVYVHQCNMTMTGGTSTVEGEYGISIWATGSSDLLITDGTVSAVGNDIQTVTTNGYLTITGGTISADLDGGAGACTAISSNELSVKIIGGTIEAVDTGGGSGECYAIWLNIYCAAAYLTGTITDGDLSADSTTSFIVEVATMTVDPAWHGSNNSITTKVGDGNVEWNTSGTIPLIEFYVDGYGDLEAIEWGDAIPPITPPSSSGGGFGQAFVRDGNDTFSPPNQTPQTPPVQTPPESGPSDDNSNEGPATGGNGSGNARAGSGDETKDVNRTLIIILAGMAVVVAVVVGVLAFTKFKK